MAKARRGGSRLVEIPLANPTAPHRGLMSATEIKAQADGLSLEDISDLAWYIRALAWRKDPRRASQRLAAQQSTDWLTQAEFEQAWDDRDQAGK